MGIQIDAQTVDVEQPTFYRLISASMSEITSDCNSFHSWIEAYDQTANDVSVVGCADGSSRQRSVERANTIAEGEDRLHRL